MSNFKLLIYKSLTIILVYLNFIIFFSLLTVVERKFLSLIQRRVGPKFVGFKGRLQFLADSIKLLTKEIITIVNINKNIFFYLPIFLLNINLLFIFNIVWVGKIHLFFFNYNFLYIIIIENITNILIVILALNTKNKFSIIAAVRLINIIYIYEISISFFFLIIFFINQSFSLHYFFYYNLYYFNIWQYIMLLPQIISIILISIKKVPFDLIESEAELIMGYLIEYSGFFAGSLILIEYIHIFFWSYLFTLLI